MLKIKNALFILFIGITLVSCINNGQSGSAGSGDGSVDYSDPDPLTEEEKDSAPKAPASLLIFVNIDGEIRSFSSDNPAAYSTVVSDVCTDTDFEQFKVSKDGQYLLYINSEKDLILYDLVASTESAIIEEDLCSNEIQFIDNDRLHYNNHGIIYCYKISNKTTYPIIENSVYACNHGAVVSQDGSRIVFKNQDESQKDSAIYVWADISSGESVSACTALGTYTGDVELLDLFDFIWFDDNNKILLKSSADINTRLRACTIGSSSPMDLNVTYDGSIIRFTSLNISDDESKLCIYGSLGCYQVDLSSFNLDNQIEVNEVYASEIITTTFADYSKDSKYLVAATAECIGVYEAETMKQTDFDYTGVISEGETIKFLCCN